MRANSLALRLFLWSTAWTVLILAVTGFLLSSLYREAVERAFDSRLGVYLKTLVADVASPDQTSDTFPQSIGEPLFELPLSGWYWQVTRLDTEKPEIRASRSLWDSHLAPIEPGRGTVSIAGVRQDYTSGPDNQRLRLVERTIDLGEEGRYLVAVAGDAAEIEDEIRAFDQALLITIGTLGLILILTTLFQVRFGLAPLKRISESLAAIRSGAAERLEGRFPQEIAPLARELNALIDANREIVERARTHVGNLAHALKTPLSVLRNEAAGRDDPLAEKVMEQAGIMHDQVTRHLERARIAARLTVVGTVTPVRPIVAALARTMEKIYRDRAIAVTVSMPADVNFRGERHDLEEMVGNLVDNACKWARGQVAIEVLAEPGPTPDRPQLRIVVDDDGPGLTAEERDQVARRGRRLDESKPGSGLGLSIVLELATLYGGRFALAAAPTGGLRVELVLPAA